MDKDKECVVLSIDRFNIYWKLLLLNYGKKHTQELFNLYYSIFREVEEKDLKFAVKEAIKKQPYFPNVNEIYKYIPPKEVPNWFNQKIEKEKLSLKELKELKELLKEFL